MNKRTMTTTVLAAALVAGQAWAQTTRDVEGSIATSGCDSIITDNRASGGELYGLKTHNPGNGPDHHRDWLFDLSAKGGGSIPGVDAGGMVWRIDDVWKRHVTPPEEAYVVMTYPTPGPIGDFVAIDSATVRMGGMWGTVQRQRVGDSLPTDIDAGIGLVLPGNAQQYTVPTITDRQTGQPARFPIGTSSGIIVAFAPVAEVNNRVVTAACTVGSEVEDPHAGFGLIAGYNVYRVEGEPTVVPQPADFIGNWVYYIDYRGFDLDVPDTAGTAGPDLNGDTMPDGDGSAAPNDGNPNDLVGISNPDGVPYSGDEVILFADVPLLPDGTPRDLGTAPDRSGAQGYWYTFQPVVFTGPTTPLEEFDLIGGWGDPEYFSGPHTMDRDGDTLIDAIDMDLDGTMDFYSPQAEVGITGLGLTNSSLPLLSSPVFAQANPAIAAGGIRLSARAQGRNVALELATGFESTAVLGYNVIRLDRGLELPVNDELILARGGYGNLYTLTDELAWTRRPSRAPGLSYLVEIVPSTGGIARVVGPFSVATSPLTGREARPPRR